MAGKEYEIAFKLAGKLAGDFQGTFKKASSTIAGMQKNVVDLNRQAAQTDKLVKLRTEVGQAALAYTQAKQKIAATSKAYSDSSRRTQVLTKEHEAAKRQVEALKKAAAESGTATKEMAQKYAAASNKADRLGRELGEAKRETAGLQTEMNQAKTALDKTKSSLDRKRESLSRYEQSIGQTSTDLKTLIQRQKELAAATEKARVAQERYNNIQGKIDASKSAQTARMDKAKSSAGSLVGLGATVAAVAAAPINTALSFEDQQAELRKFTDDHATVFADLKGLTTEYGKSIEDMTAMASNAYQSGIVKTAADAKKLVEAQTQAAVAFGMTGDAIGTAWADIQSKMQLDVGATKSVFDLINKLGNETTASSADIVEVMQRSGGAAKALTKLSEQQVVAMSAAFRSASVSPEVASTSMMSFVNTLTVGANATKSQKEAFEALGIDAVKLAKDMNGSSETAQAAIQGVLAKIKELPADERSSFIGKLFGNEAGVKAAVATLSTNTNMLGNNLKIAGDKASYAGSMLAEYKSRADTTSETLTIAKNSLRLVANNIGSVMLPYVRSAAEAFTNWSSIVATFVEKNQTLVGVLLKVGGNITAMVAAFHLLRIASAVVMAPVSALYQGYLRYQQALTLANAATLTGQKLTIAQRMALMLNTAATKAATLAQQLWTAAKNGTLRALIAEKVGLMASKAVMLANAVATKVAAAAQWVLNSAFWACPITWIVAGIAAVVAAGIWLYRNWDMVKAKTLGLWATFQEKFPVMATIVRLAFLPIQVLCQVVINVFKLLGAAGIALFNGLKWAFEAISGVSSRVWNSVSSKVMEIWGKFRSFVSFVLGAFKSGFITAFSGIRDKVASVFSGLVGIIKKPMNAVIALVNKAIGAINGISVDIPKWAGGGKLGFNIPKIPALAAGGIVTSPTLALIGEGRESEAVLPLSKLAQLTRGAIGGMTVTYSPVINVSGGSGDVRGEVRRAERDSLADFKREFARLQAELRRVSYA